MNGARPRIGNRPVFNRKIVLASSEARESHVSRDSRQVFDSRVEHLTREGPGNEAGFLLLALGVYRKPLGMGRVVADWQAPCTTGRTTVEGQSCG